MPVTFPKIRVGEPVRHETLSVFPLFSESMSEVDYLLSDAALSDESILVEEIDEGGSVPELLVENKGDLRVLFLEGEELLGAKQNRILNTSVLVAAHSKIRIPVSCVEQGRWGYESKHFKSSGSHSPLKVRRALKESVARSVKEDMGHTSDQHEVWNEVESLHAEFSVDSNTKAMSDAFDAHEDKITLYKEKLTYIDDATGMAFAIGNKIVAMELFDKSSTCEKVWERILSGVVFDAMEAKETEKHASVKDVEKLIKATDKMKWKQSEAVGEGDEFRAESKKGNHASALAYEETIVHESVVAGV